MDAHSPLTAASSQVRCSGLGMSWLAFTTDRSARPPKFDSKPQMRWLVASIESSWADGSWSSRWLQCTVTRSPGFQLRTAEPTRSTTPEASEPTTWWSRAWRLPHALSLPRRSRNPKVGSGSKIDVHTVLKLMEDAITPRYTSSGASSGVGTSPTWSDLRGSLSSDSTPSHIVCSARSTWAAR